MARTGEMRDAAAVVPSAAEEDASPPPPPSFHDLLALGEMSTALSLSKREDGWRRPDDQDCDGGDNGPAAAATAAVAPAHSPRRRRRGGDAEVARLPSLLRLLAASQPLASVPFLPGAGGGGGDEDGDAAPGGGGDDGELVDEAVSRLEAAAASHPEAEGVDVVATFLAPEACRRIGRLPALRRVRAGRSLRRPGGSEWDLGALADVTASAVGTGPGGGSKRRRRENSDGTGGDNDSADEIRASDTEGDADEDEEMEEATPAKAVDAMPHGLDIPPEVAAQNRMLAELLPESAAKRGKKRKAPPETSGGGGGMEYSELSALFRSARSAEEDSVQSAVARTLGEVAALVASGLEYPPTPATKHQTEETSKASEEKDDPDEGKDAPEPSEGGDGESGGASGRPSHPSGLGYGGVALPVKSDSMLAEPAAEDGAATMGGADLPATVASIMHHAPVLRHAHLSNALCRAAVPQTSALVCTLAANCTAAIPSLLRGCVDAALAAEDDPSSEAKNVARSATAAMTAVADLSPAEAWGSAVRLIEARTAPGLALKVMMREDVDAAAAMILQELALPKMVSKATADAESGKAGSESEPEAAGSGSVRDGGRLRYQESQDEEEKAAPPSDAPAAKKVYRRKIRPKQGTARRPPDRLWLVEALLQDDSLACLVRKGIVSCISEMGSSEGAIIWGRAALLVRAYAALVFRVGIGSGSSAGSGSTYVESAMTAIAALAKILAVSKEGDASSPSSPGDEFRRAALCACVATCCRFPSIGDAGGLNSSSTAACLDCLLVLLRPSISDQSDAFASRVAGFVSEGSEVATDLLFGDDHSSRYAVGEGPQVESFPNVCRWAASKIGMDELSEIVKRGWTPPSVLADSMAAVDAMRRRQITKAESEALLRDILEDPHKCRTIFKKTGVTLLIRTAVDFLADGPGSKVPLILPLRLEALAHRVPWKHSDLLLEINSDPTGHNPIRFQFVLQLYYAMLFADHVPESPFRVNPRALPLGSALLFCELRAKGSIESGGEMAAVASELESLISKHCPEMVPKNELSHGLHCNFFDASSGLSSNDFSRQVTPTMVANAIKACVQDDKDVSGRRAERFFLKSRADFPSADVDGAACSALFSSRYSPPRLHSYSSLCRDPLVLLRCNVAVWRCRGVRRIILSILRRLLDSNRSITQEISPSESVALEMLAARDVLVARCLIIADSGGYTFESSAAKDKIIPTHCPMTVNLVRSMVAQQRGLVAMLIKQGLPDHAVDWLTECVPESLVDASILSSCLSERNTLTAAERLAAADAALRIAVAHGPSGSGSEDEAAAQGLAYSALTVLVSSFFLALGPVGVPVNVVYEEDGRDVTQTCRRAMFRMLGVIPRIGCKRIGMRNEARLALGKLAGLCKSESAMGSVAGGAAMRRKALLKEIWDAVVRAGNSLGGVQV